MDSIPTDKSSQGVGAVGLKTSISVCTELNPDSYIGTRKKMILANAMTSYYGSTYVINHAKGYYSARFILKAYLPPLYAYMGVRGGNKVRI
ncbi:hypothetical protein NXX52_23795 [Bacteroides ovatus]|nr:hypothetical protein [Bacteroides ovatus]